MVESEAKSLSLQVEIIDIEEDDALIAEFGIRIPVVLGPGDMILAEGEIEPKSLRRALRRL